MDHYETLLNELRAIDKRMLRRLDRKRSPPESMPKEIWYGKDIPRDKLDWLMGEGGFPYLEGTPMLLGIYSQYAGNKALLFTTVGMYAVNTNYEFAGKRKLYEKVTYPLRYADYQEIYGIKDRDGFYSTRFPVIRKDGEQDQLYALFFPVMVSSALNRCVACVNEHGYIEADPPVIRTGAEEDQAQAIERFCSDGTEPVFPCMVDLRPRTTPAPAREIMPRCPNPDPVSREAERKLNEFRRYAREKKLPQMLQCLQEACRLGSGTALWLSGQISRTSDYEAMVKFDMVAAESGCQEAAADLEYFFMAMADVARKQQDLAMWETWLDKAIAMGGTTALCYGARGYLWGEDGIPRNRKKAVELLRLAASMGSRKAMLLLGEAYDAQPEPELREDARKYLAQAAQEGSTEALLLLCRHFGMESEAFRRDTWNMGLAAYATASSRACRQDVAKALQYLAVTPGEYALWRAAERCWSTE